MTADLRTKLMQKRSLRAAVNAERKGNPLALLKEIVAVTRATTRLTALRIPLAVGKSLWSDPAIDGAGNPTRTLEVLGSALLDYINDLGPIYGKAGQILLSRLDPERQELAAKLQLDRLYGQWPALGIDEVLEIMDRDVPEWRKYLKRIETMPLGIASISQVHAATDHEGKEWVVKVIKPEAHKRLSETVDAMEQILAVLEPLTVTRASKKAVGEARELCESYRGELSLRRELDTIQRVRSAMNDGRKQKLLRVPRVFEECSSDRVLLVERFRGVLFSDVVSGRATIDPSRRSMLARKVLQDLLVQVFELGLFHADPHAGNLIMMDDGTVGLFDWGLSGELLPSDRRHIASVLRALISVDLDGLVDALAGIAEESGREVDRKEIARELRGFTSSLKAKKTSKETSKEADKETSKDTQTSDASAPKAEKSQSLHKMLDQCLRAADRLGIPVPSGLLMMAKTLVTIEGLARGIDPDIKLAYAATPVLLRVARPSLRDWFRLAGKLPSLMKQFSKILVAGVGMSAMALGPLVPDLNAATAILGDSLATGGATHPQLSYDPQNIWRIMNGSISLTAKASDIPSATDWNIKEQNPAAPVSLLAGVSEYRGSTSNVFSALIQSGVTAFLGTAQYAWGYLLARKFGEAPDQILLAAEDGARMEDAPAQAWRVVNHVGDHVKGKGVGEGSLARVMMLFGGNDICAPAYESMTEPAQFKASALDAMRIFMAHQKDRSTNLEIMVVQPLPMVQLIASDLVLNKKVMAYGEETTCKDLQGRMFLPKKAMDLGEAPDARQVALISQFLPPNPALMCATLFGRVAEGGGDRFSKIGNRLRALRDALSGAVADARKEAARAGLADRISFKLIESPGKIELTADDIAGDCFHLSAKGQAMLARTILAPPAI